MTRTIITGVDGSPQAGVAAGRAAELATALGARLHVISAYGRLEGERIQSGGEEFVISNERDAEVIVARSVAELARAYPDVAITSSTAGGRPGAALVRAAELLDADLIVVGNKRVQGMGRVLGSIARDVAAQARCDLYVAYTHPR